MYVIYAFRTGQNYTDLIEADSPEEAVRLFLRKVSISEIWRLEEIRAIEWSRMGFYDDELKRYREAIKDLEDTK